MKPSSYIKSKYKTLREQLNIALLTLDSYLSVVEVESVAKRQGRAS